MYIVQIHFAKHFNYNLFFNRDNSITCTEFLCFVSLTFQRLIPTHCHISSDLIIFFTLFFTIRYFETCIIQPLNLTEDGLGNLAALRTFRVLRALKTVAVIPGNSYRTLSLYMCLVKAYVTFSSPGMLRR